MAVASPSAAGEAILKAVLVLLLALSLQSPAPGGPSTYTAKEIAGYRLSRPVFERFVHASRLIVKASGDDPRLAADPLFTRDVSVLDDVVVAAQTLDTRLQKEPALRSALQASRMAPREYTTFALALFAARLAHGFVKSGAMRYVPEGVTKDNVTFIETHEREVSALLQMLGLEDP